MAWDATEPPVERNASPLPLVPQSERPAERRTHHGDWHLSAGISVFRPVEFLLLQLHLSPMRPHWGQCLFPRRGKRFRLSEYLYRVLRSVRLATVLAAPSGREPKGPPATVERAF